MLRDCTEYNLPNPEKETLNDRNALKGQRPVTRLQEQRDLRDEN